MWHWLIINCDFNLVWGGLYASSPIPQTTGACNSKDTCCGRHDKTSILLLGDDSMFYSSLWSHPGGGVGGGALATNQYLNLHQHRKNDEGVSSIPNHSWSSALRTLHVCVYLCVYMYLFPCACVSYVSHYGPQARLPPSPILISHLFSFNAAKLATWVCVCVCACVCARSL